MIPSGGTSATGSTRIARIEEVIPESCLRIFDVRDRLSSEEDVGNVRVVNYYIGDSDDEPNAPEVRALSSAEEPQPRQQWRTHYHGGELPL